MGPLRGIRVVVVGAGLSGLVAARALARDGAAVHVIEARDRLGGRVWTLRDGVFAPFVVEAGGEFIDGSHKAIRALARELGLDLVRVLREGFGLSLNVGDRIKVLHQQRSIWKAFKRSLAPVAAAFEEVECDWDTSLAAAIGRRSLDALLASSNASTDVRAMAQALRGFFLADSDTLSALVGVELSLEDTDPGHVPLFRIKGGNDRLIFELTRGIDVTFSGRHAVKAIRQYETEVHLGVEGPDKTLHQLVFDYAVVTVPAPILLEWVFTPALPEDQRRAFEALSYGTATKALLAFGHRWWLRRERPRAYGSNLSIGAVWEAAEEQRGSAILTLLAGGRASGELQAIIDREGSTGVVQRLAWLGKPASLQAFEEIRWDRDPWARGGYGFFGTSFPPSWRDLLSRAFGRVLFAGDHTSRDYQGYMNGAVESGQRVARELAALEELGRLTSRPAL